MKLTTLAALIAAPALAQPHSLETDVRHLALIAASGMECSVDVMHLIRPVFAETVQRHGLHFDELMEMIGPRVPEERRLLRDHPEYRAKVCETLEAHR